MTYASSEVIGDMGPSVAIRVADRLPQFKSFDKSKLFASSHQLLHYLLPAGALARLGVLSLRIFAMADYVTKIS